MAKHESQLAVPWRPLEAQGQGRKSALPSPLTLNNREDLAFVKAEGFPGCFRTVPTPLGHSSDALHSFPQRVLNVIYCSRRRGALKCIILYLGSSALQLTHLGAFICTAHCSSCLLGGERFETKELRKVTAEL